MPVADPDQLPTLWDPKELYAHLALLAGAPAAGVAIVVWLLGIYSSVQGWLEWGKSAVRTAGAAPGMLGTVRDNVRGRLSRSRRGRTR